MTYSYTHYSVQTTPSRPETGRRGINSKGEYQTGPRAIQSPNPQPHKEEFIFDFITKLGTIVFDNDPAARTNGAAFQPIKGVTTGRNYKGELNGSMTVDDIFDMYAAVMLNGFTPDTLLVHPMASPMRVKDTGLRDFAIQAAAEPGLFVLSAHNRLACTREGEEDGDGYWMRHVGQRSSRHRSGVNCLAARRRSNMRWHCSRIWRVCSRSLGVSAELTGMLS